MIVEVEFVVLVEVVGQVIEEFVQKSHFCCDREVRHVVFLVEEDVHRHDSSYVFASTTQLS